MQLEQAFGQVNVHELRLQQRNLMASTTDKMIWVVIEYTQSHVKTSSKLTKLKIKSLIKEYNGQ